MSIKKVAVIGAGTMGAGIAGQVANAGIEVILLDLPSDGDEVNAIAQAGKDRLSNPEAPGLMDQAAAQRLTVGNIRDHLQLISQCDWVAEAVVERLDIKHALYRQLAQFLPAHAILSSNTSTIPIRLLIQGMDSDLASRFAITHFFNPVRFMRLLELVGGEHTRPDVINTLAQFCDAQLGKGVVQCLDTPGFLANRVGCFAIQFALHEAAKLGLNAPTADAIFGRPMGLPKTGVFGLYDLIGIDLMADVAKSLTTILPAEDGFHAVGSPLGLMSQMIANDQRGNKSKQGFYRSLENGSRQYFDFDSKQYQDFERPKIEIAERAERDGVAELLSDQSVLGQYAWSVLSHTLCYAAALLPEVGNSPAPIDDAMKLGYNWIQGPIELIDAIGAEYIVHRLRTEKREIPPYLAMLATRKLTAYRVENNQLQVLNFDGKYHDLQRAAGIERFNETRLCMQAAASNESASWYRYHGAALVEFHTKANALDGQSMAIIAAAQDAVEAESLSGLIIHNDAQHFSCGVNLEAVRGFFNHDDYAGLDAFLAHFQRTVHRLSTANYPVVAAPVGLSIGGGFEVVVHCQHVIANSNSVMGLVESLVGLVPGGGGCKETLYRLIELHNGDVEKGAWQAFMNLGFGKTATSPQLSQSMGLLREDDDYLMNRDRMLVAALEFVNTGQTRPHLRPPIAMAGRDLYKKMLDWLHQAKEKGVLFEHDVVVGSEIAEIVSGGDIDPGTPWSEQALFDAERRAFLRLAKSSATRERINSMLDRGISIRN